MNQSVATSCKAALLLASYRCCSVLRVATRHKHDTLFRVLICTAKDFSGVGIAQPVK